MTFEWISLKISAVKVLTLLFIDAPFYAFANRADLEQAAPIDVT